MSEEQPESNIISKCIRAVFGSKQSETLRDAIEDLIEEAHENGEEDFSQHEQLLLNNILELEDKTLSNAMTPRADIIAFNKDGTVTELAELMVAKGHSRIPVFGENLDDIKGIVHILDLARLLLENKGDTKVEDIIHNEVKFIADTTSVLDLLHDMQSSKTHIAMVIDEYGGVDGLITIEDLLEEIVGDIEDEHDVEENISVQVLEDGNIIADARAELDEIKETIGIDLYEKPDAEDAIEIDTLGGYVFNLAQRVPNVGEIIEDKNKIKFEVLEADPRRIKKIKIIRT